MPLLSVHLRPLPPCLWDWLAQLQLPGDASAGCSGFGEMRAFRAAAPLPPKEDAVGVYGWSPRQAAGTGPFLTSVDAAGTGQTWLGTDSGNLQKFMSPFDRPKMACLLWAWLKLLYTHSSVHPFVPLSIHPTNISTHPLGTRLCSGCWVQRNRCDVPPLVFVMWFIFYILQLF